MGLSLLQFQGPSDFPPEVVEIVTRALLTLTVIVLGIPIIRAITKRFERPAVTAPSPDVTARLERIEQAVEAVAIEVERIAEAQRYSAKLLDSKLNTPSR